VTRAAGRLVGRLANLAPAPRRGGGGELLAAQPLLRHLHHRIAAGRLQTGPYKQRRATAPVCNRSLHREM